MKCVTFCLLFIFAIAPFYASSAAVNHFGGFRRQIEIRELFEESILNPLLLARRSRSEVGSLCKYTNEKKPQHATDRCSCTLPSFSLPEQIGQLFMPSLRLNRPGAVDQMKKLIKEYHVGGVLLLLGGGAAGWVDAPLGKERLDPVDIARLINELQQESDTPLLIAIDAEWGLPMCGARNAIRFPYAMTLGAIQDDQLIYDLGYEIGRQCKALGVHINFAPVVDINSNPLNPVIHMRSFGDNKELVAQKAVAYMVGLQDAGILSCAKHFPGHGDTIVDSHVGLPVIKQNVEQLLARELYPFEMLIDAGVDMVMSAHILVPALDDTPTSLSYNVLTTLLRERFFFDGLVVTDGLHMRAIRDTYASNEAAILAFQAGNDIILDSEDPILAIEGFIKAVEENQISRKQIQQSAAKIMDYKHILGLFESHERSSVSTNEVTTENAFLLCQQLYQQAITVVQDTEAQIPLSATKKYLFLNVGSAQDRVMEDVLKNNIAARFLQLSLDPSDDEIAHTVSHIEHAEIVVISLYAQYIRSDTTFGITKGMKKLYDSLRSAYQELIVILYGSPYGLSYFADAATLIAAYENVPAAQQAVAKVLSGVYIPSGILPVMIL